MVPTYTQAMQFCIMLDAGLPASVAIQYFVQAEDPKELAQSLTSWMKSASVAKAQSDLMGKDWKDMDLEEKMRSALNQHYAQLAYVLRSNHYGEVGPSDLAKLNTARSAIEAKLAGTAGKLDSLSQFIADLNSGKLKKVMGDNSTQMPVKTQWPQ